MDWLDVGYTHKIQRNAEYLSHAKQGTQDNAGDLGSGLKCHLWGFTFMTIKA